MLTDVSPQLASTCSPTHPVLVLGLGNILLRDEGIGVHVVRAMQDMILPTGVELYDGGTAGFALRDVLANRPKVIVIDAIDAGHAPGTVLRLDPRDLAERPEVKLSLHEVSFAETLRAAERLGLAPREVVILGVQPQTVACGLDLSPQIAGLIPQIVELVRAELERTPQAEADCGDAARSAARKLVAESSCLEDRP
jgi:hydrogenase maturation protease